MDTTLPLIDRARNDGVTFVLTRKNPHALVNIQSLVETPRIPARTPGAGEQYRFHFDMTKCIGCKCCVVACNEQNGNPASINWRRVGEVEGGYYPYTQRFYLSMGCNHCLEPSCMLGCPVEAYHKDPLTGVVVHNADTCIGCQYCTWNCSYGVPQYNPERGVVGKCDLCHNRLADSLAPACVSACPEGAIAIEIVKVDEWRKDYVSADAPGLPSASDSLSTTRVTLPKEMAPDTGRVDTNHVRPGEPHWPLVFMLVSTQLAVGSFAVLWWLGALGRTASMLPAALASLVVAFLSLGASTMHLGRPIHAYRAIKGWKRSWLSREVLTLGLFAKAAAAYAGVLLFGLPGASMIGFATVLFGVIGVTCSARIYMVPARPAWNSVHTVTEFFATGLLLGPLFAVAAGISNASWVAWLSFGGAALQLGNQALKLLWLARSEQFEYRSSAILLSNQLKSFFLLRLALLIAGGLAAPLLVGSQWMAALALLAALTGELMGRWLFFVSVVPKSIAASFGARRAA